MTIDENDYRCATCETMKDRGAFSEKQLALPKPVCRECQEKKRQLKFRRRNAADYRPKPGCQENA